MLYPLFEESFQIRLLETECTPGTLCNGQTLDLVRPVFIFCLLTGGVDVDPVTCASVVPAILVSLAGVAAAEAVSENTAGGSHHGALLPGFDLTHEVGVGVVFRLEVSGLFQVAASLIGTGDCRGGGGADIEVRVVTGFGLADQEQQLGMVFTATGSRGGSIDEREAALCRNHQPVYL